MNRKNNVVILLILILLSLSACVPAPIMEADISPEALSFSGEQALETVEEFVMQFPNRDSGQPNNRLSIDWLSEKFTSYGLDCAIDEWQVVNFSQPVKMNNLTCRLAGESPKEIVIAAHHDQSPQTVYGADNDGSGIAIMLQLAEIFSEESKLPYTLVFVSSDGEEYGMLGTQRFVETHPDIDQLIAGISLDNLGKYFYYNLEMSPIGRFEGYGPIWLQLLAQDAARASDDLWVPPIRIILDQVLNQAVPVSFMDQGPLVAVGVPALGFSGLVTQEYEDERFYSYHSPTDVIDLQSAEVLYQSGRIPESLIRALLAMEEFPEESGPYLYFVDSGEVLRGPGLWSIFIAFTLIFFLATFLRGKRDLKEKLISWKAAFPHFVSLWLPLLFGFLLTYIMVAVGLMDKYDSYPATPRNAAIFEPRWPAVILFLLGLWVFFALGRKWSRKFEDSYSALSEKDVQSMAFGIIGFGAVYLLLVSPFSLLFLVPVLFWLLIQSKPGWTKVLDLLFFLLGFLVVYGLIYFFGFVILRNGFAVLWYLLMMFSIQEIGFFTLVVITAIFGAGLTMMIKMPKGK